MIGTQEEAECRTSGEHVHELPLLKRLHFETITDPCLHVPVFPVCPPAAPGVWPQIPAAAPVRFLTRIRAATFSSSTPCIHSPFPFVYCQRSLRSPTPLHPMLNLLGPDAAREAVG